MQRWIAVALYIASFSITALFWKGHHEALAGLDRSDLELAIGQLCGLSGTVALAWQLLFISRIKLLESRFGLDRLTGVHHWNAVVAVVCILAHAPLVTRGIASASTVTPSEQLIDFWYTWTGLKGAIIGALALIALAVLSIGPLRRRVRYERWYLPHTLAYLAIAVVFSHQITKGEEFVDHPSATAVWEALAAAVAASFAFSRFGVPIMRLWRHGFVVDRVVAECSDVTSVYICGRRLDTLPARGGQFVRVRFLAGDFWTEAHPFSLSLAPDGKILRLTIKASGDFTRRIPALPIGTRVLIDGPHGVFTAARATRPKVLLIAGGIGITPIRAILDDLLREGRDIVLLYTNRTRASTALRDELEKACAGRVRLEQIASDMPASDGGTGRLDAARIRSLVPDFLERDVFLCGPPQMMDSIRSILRLEGVPPSAIIDERFAL